MQAAVMVPASRMLKRMVPVLPGDEFASLASRREVVRAALGVRTGVAIVVCLSSLGRERGTLEASWRKVSKVATVS